MKSANIQAIPTAPDGPTRAKSISCMTRSRRFFIRFPVVGAHKDAVSLFERYSKGGENAKLKQWAGKTLPTLRHQLTMAENRGKKNNGSTLLRNLQLIGTFAIARLISASRKQLPHSFV